MNWFVPLAGKLISSGASAAVVFVTVVIVVQSARFVETWTP
jgi:hypothetical protein